MNRYSKYQSSQKGKDREKRYLQKHPEKKKAQNKARFLYKTKQECCIKGCFKIGERHHPNYDKPEIIFWLCKEHHLLIHGKIKGQCEVCGKPQHAKNLCVKHYRQKQREDKRNRFYSITL